MLGLNHPLWNWLVQVMQPTQPELHLLVTLTGQVLQQAGAGWLVEKVAQWVIKIIRRESQIFHAQALHLHALIQNSPTSAETCCSSCLRIARKSTK